jgi:glycosyltransferase involved in cell wall biosynthesis
VPLEPIRGQGVKRLAIVSLMKARAWGASEELWYATALRAQGCEVLVSVHAYPGRAGQFDRLSAAGVTVVRRRQRTAPERLAPRVARRIRPDLAEIRRFRPDLVLVNHGATYELTWEADIARDLEQFRLAGLPLVALCHGINDLAPPVGGQRDAARRILGGFHTLWFTSESHRRQVERHLAVDLATAGVFQNPIVVHDEVPWPDSTTLRFASVGRLATPEKGQDLLVAALAARSWRDADWRLTFYGDGPDEAYLRTLVDRHDLADRIGFGGFVPPDRIWADNHVLVMSSRLEGLPLVLIEAMTAARPAVAPDVGGIAERLVDGESGFLAVGPTVRALGEALDRMWASRDRLRQLGQYARRRVTAWRSPDPAGDLLAALQEIRP